jgi:hypothetical protein
MIVNLVNRAALTVIPKKPYIDWANSLDDQEPKLTPNAAEWEYTVYLVDDVGDEDGLPEALEKHYAEIFAEELAAWTPDENSWPKQMDAKTFKEWFDVRLSTTVLDLSDDQMDDEEF